MARNGLTREEVAAILAAQAGRAERLAAADDVIVNTASSEALATAVEALNGRYRDLAGKPPP
jgi:dephospho-CoA kinase